VASRPPNPAPDEHVLDRRLADALAKNEPAIERALLLAFAPLHKRVFGLAIGAAVAVLFAAITIIAVLRDPAHGLGLGLLGVYFRGYSVSWPGVLVGAAWGGMVGFVAGWFAAFCRNLVLATWLLYIRARAAFSQSRDFLDHI
jgi:hypothetical protein